MNRKRKKSFYGWIWKGKGIKKEHRRTLSGVQETVLVFYTRKPWEAQRVRITIEEIK